MHHRRFNSQGQLVSMRYGAIDPGRPWSSVLEAPAGYGRALGALESIMDLLR